MSPVVADASVAIRGDLKPFMKDLRGAEKPTATLGQKLNGLLSPANLLGGLAVGTAGAQISQFIGSAVADASNLEQAAGAVESVFGDASGAIETFGETSAESFGLSKREVRQLGAVLGAQLQGMGFDAETAADKVVDLEQRGADLAATFGGTVGEAVQAISALMRGERDSIEKYGTSIKDVDIQARIAALGLDTSTAAAEKNAEATAALDLLFESTAASAGAAGRESNTLAGQQARLTANMEDVSAEVGERLLPLMVDFMQFLNETGIPTLREFSELLDFGDTGSAEGIPVLSEMEDFFNSFPSFGAKLNDQILGRKEAIQRAADDLGLTYETLRGRIHRVMDRVGVDHDEALRRVSGQLEALPSMTSTAMLDTIAAWKQADLGGQAGQAFEPVGDAIRDEVAEGSAEAVEVVRQTPGEMATALEQGREAWRLSWEQMLEASTDELGKAGRIQEALAALNSVELTEALASDDPARQAWAIQTRRDLIAALDIDGYNYGLALIQTYLKGLRDARPELEHESGAIAAQLRGTWAINSEPKDPNSPFRGVTTWGGNFIDTIAEGMRDRMPVLRATMDGINAPSIGELAPGIEGGTTYNSPSYHVTMQTPKVHTIEDVGYGLKRLGEMGILPGSREE